MKIRLTGTEAEARAGAAMLRDVLDVREESGFYPNRGASRLGRIYLDAETTSAPNSSTTPRRKDNAS